MSLKRPIVSLILISLIVSSCVSCVSYLRNRPREATVENVGSVTYKIVQTVTVIIDQQEDFAAGRALLPASVEQYSGTGSMIDRTPTGALVMTAGHLCELTGDLIDGGSVLMSSYALIGIDGEAHDGIVLVDDDTIDICILLVPDAAGRPIKLADQDPERGATVYYIGAPGSFWLPGTIPVFEGLFGGTVEHDGVQYSLVTVWAEGGASGSPIFAPGYGILGVLVKNTHARGGGAVTIAVNWRDLRKPIALARKEAQKVAPAEQD